jgi:hypothetical protein
MVVFKEKGQYFFPKMDDNRVHNIDPQSIRGFQDVGASPSIYSAESLSTMWDSNSDPSFPSWADFR